MKFTTVAVAAAALAGVVTADTLGINNPTVGTTWKLGETYFISWSGNCAAMGNAGKAVAVDLMTGPSGALRFVAKLDPLDCATAGNVRSNVTVPADVAPGKYVIQVHTTSPSYSNEFDIVGATSATTPSTPAPTQTPPSAGAMLQPKMMLALAGTAAAAFQFLF